MNESESIKRFRQGEVIFEEKDKNPLVYRINTGSVRLYKTKGDELVELSILKSGDYLGLLSFLMGEGAYYCNAEALENVEIENITEQFNQMMLSSNEFLFTKQYLCYSRSVCLNLIHIPWC